MPPNELASNASDFSAKIDKGAGRFVASALTKSYGSVCAVKEFDLTLHPGQIVGLVGPDGAGKSTLMKILAGILEPSSGTVEMGDVPAHDARLKIGFVSSSQTLYSELTIDDNLRFCADIRNVDRKRFEKLRDELLEKLELSDARSRFAGKLSGGMKRKLALCCALISEPDILLLDELTTGVDVLSRREIWLMLCTLASNGKSIAVAIPHPDEAAYCHRIILMNGGQIIESGEPRELRERSGLRRIQLTVDRGDISKLHELLKSELSASNDASVVDLHLLGDNIVLLVKDVDRARDFLKKVVEPSHVQMQSQVMDITLEDLYIALLITRGNRLHDPEGSPDSPLAQQSRPQVEREKVETAAKYQDSSAELRSCVRDSASVVEVAGPSTAQKKPALELKSVSKAYERQQVVNDVNLTLQRGEIFGLLGANGAGKTTLIKIICGLIAGDKGEIRILGSEDSLRKSSIRRRVGYMSQQFILYEELTIEETLKFYASSYGLNGSRLKEKVEWALTAIDLNDVRGKRIAGSPHGWKQKVAFASSIMHDPELLFLDEPTAGVDPVEFRLMWSIIRKLASNGNAIFITTHLMQEAENCNRLAFLVDGSITSSGTPEELKKESRGKCYQITVPDALQAITALQGYPATGRITITAEKLRLLVTEDEDLDVEEIEKELQRRGITVHHIERTGVTLEEAFITATGNTANANASGSASASASASAEGRS